MVLIGDPPKWLIQVQRNRKYLFRIAVVGQYIWAETACWKTAKGAGSGLKIQWNYLRIPTPWITLALGIWITVPSASAH